jgi:hypothetical protein
MAPGTFVPPDYRELLMEAIPTILYLQLSGTKAEVAVGVKRPGCASLITRLWMQTLRIEPLPETAYCTCSQLLHSVIAVAATSGDPLHVEPVPTIIKAPDAWEVCLKGLMTSVDLPTAEISDTRAAVYVIDLSSAASRPLRNALLANGSVRAMAYAMSRLSRFETFKPLPIDADIVEARIASIDTCIAYISQVIEEDRRKVKPWLQQALDGKMLVSISRFMDFYTQATPEEKRIFDDTQLPLATVHVLLPVQYWLTRGSFATFRQVRRAYTHLNIMDQLPEMSWDILKKVKPVRRHPTMEDVFQTWDECKVQWYGMEIKRQHFKETAEVEACCGPAVCFLPDVLS